MRFAFRILLSCLLLVGGIFVRDVRAQGAADRPLEKFIPADVLIYARFRGFDKAFDEFKGTAIRNLLTEPQVRVFREEVSRTISRMLDSMVPGLAEKCEELRGIFGCEVALAILAENRAVLVVDASRHVEVLKELIDLHVNEVKRAGGRVEEVAFRDMRILHVGEHRIGWLEGALILSQDHKSFQQTVRTFLGEVPSIATEGELKAVRAKTRGEREFLMLHVRVDRLVKSLTERRPGWDEMRPLVKSLGLLDVKCVHLNVAPDAPGVRVFFYLHTPGGPKGLLRMLPDKPLDEKRLLAQVPAGTTRFLLLRASVAKSLDVTADISDAVGYRENFEQGLRLVNEKLGFDLCKDLLDVLGDEIILRVLPADDGKVNVMLTVNVLDEAKLRASVEKLLGFIPEEKVRLRRLEHRGTTVYTVEGPAGVPISLLLQPAFAVGKGRLILGSGLDAVIEALDAPEVQPKSLIDDAEFMRYRRRMPKNVSMIGYVDLRKEAAESYVLMKKALRASVDGVDPLSAEFVRLIGRLPAADVIAPHLFPSIATFRFDGEGFMFETYGPIGGITNPGTLSSVGGGCLAAGMILPGFAAAEAEACRARCRTNLMVIGLAIKQYAINNDDRFPETFGGLLKGGYLTTTKLLFCPSSSTRLPDDFPADYRAADLSVLNRIDALSDYVMVKGVKAASPPDFILVHDKPGNHRGEGRNCLHVDGHVRWYTEVEFQRMLREQRQRMAERNK